MKLIVIMWIMTLGTLDGQDKVYNGTIDDCLRDALAFNSQQKEAFAGCYITTKSSPWIPGQPNRR